MPKNNQNEIKPIKILIRALVRMETITDVCVFATEDTVRTLILFLAI